MKLYIQERFRTIVEEDEDAYTPERISRELTQIANNLGYQYEEFGQTYGKGIISIRNDLNIIIRYNTQLTDIRVSIGDNDGNMNYNCTKNSSDIDEVSVALQTASMICNEIRQKIGY